MIVSNTSPIINLACIGRLDVLHALFGEMVIPDAVFYEITGVVPNAPGALDVRTAPWIRPYSVVNRPLVDSLRLELDPGEAEAIACAVEANAKLLLIDERRGRRVAQRLGLPITGLVGALLLARNRRLIASIRPLLDDLRQVAGFWISDALYYQAIHNADE